MKSIFVLIITLAPVLVTAQKLSNIKKQALAEVEGLEQQINQVSQTLWDYSETALKEHKSAELLIAILQKEGFTIEQGVSGMPTAFVATYGGGSPVIGILAEYDALPGVGNAAVPYKAAREDGLSSGQGCGHNLFGSACVNAAIAIKRTMVKNNVKGTIKLFGTPAEETVVGKVYMAKDGIFDGLDAVIEWHPSTETTTGYERSIALNNFEVEFFGQAAHGAADPWNGRSALDAVEMMNYGVNMMREHIYPTTRIHYVIPNGGDAPNVVPEYAKVWYYVRDTSRSNVEKYYQRILDIAEGAALATATTHKVKLITGVHSYNVNGPLIMAIEKNLQIVGPPSFTEEEQEWGKKLQEAAQKEQKGFNTKIKAVPEGWEKIPPNGGSTDVAEVSYITPTAGFGVATAPIGVPWHSWATSASHGTMTGFKGAQVATKVLALTGMDLLTNKKLRDEARAYFDKKTEGKAYKSPLPKEQKVTLPGQ
jgi:aminobenzoyl-glutamate utilization protein B